MLMSLIVLLLVAIVAYFHYVQGFFSATLSAICAILAAVVAFGFHEWIVRSFVAAYIPDLGSALVMVALFALVYTILRVVFDTYVPGNLTFPLMIDRIGGAAVGAVAGVFAAGVLVIAVQTLPFGPVIGGYARFAVSSDPIEGHVPKVPDVVVNELLQSETLGPAEEKHLLIPVDDIVVSVTSRLSENGSLAGPQPVSAVHPAYLNELFFQRLGVQTAAKHVALNQPGKDSQVDVKGLFSPLPTDPLPQADAEVSNIYSGRKVPAALFTDSGSTLLIVRATIGGGAVDKDNKVRLSPASVRLVIKGKNFMPIGTIDMTTAVQLRRNQPDDFIVADAGATIDFAFLIPNENDLLVAADSKVKNGPLKLAPGAFLEVKRFADVELNMAVKREKPPLLPEKAGTVLRKKDLPQSSKAVPIRVTPTPTGSTPEAQPSGGSDVPFEYGSKSISNELPSPVNVGTHDSENGDVPPFPSGTATLKDGKLAKFEVKPVVAIAQLSQGDNQIKQLWTDEGLKVVQIIGTPSTKAEANVWEWADKLGQFELVDNAGKSYKPRGAWVQVKMTSGNFEDRIAAKYEAAADLFKFEHAEGRPTDVRIFFVIFDSAQPQTLKMDGKVIASVN